MNEILYKRESFKVSFLGKIFFTIISDYCLCCLQRCLRKCGSYSRKKQTYEKFELALDRLSKEQDILNIIAAIRVGKFLQNVSLLKRQRRAVTEFKNYVISDKDLDEEPQSQAFQHR